MLKFRLIEDDCESEQAEVILFKNVDEWNAAIALMKYEVLCKGRTGPLTSYFYGNIRIIETKLIICLPLNSCFDGQLINQN